MNYDVLLIKMQLDCKRNVNKKKLNDDMITLFSGEIDLKIIFSKKTISIDTLLSLLTQAYTKKSSNWLDFCQWIAISNFDWFHLNIKKKTFKKLRKEV